MGCQLSAGRNLGLYVSNASYAVMEICRAHIRDEERAKAFDSDGFYLWHLSREVVRRANEATALDYAAMSEDFRKRYSKDDFEQARAFITEVAGAGASIECSH